MTDQDSKPIVVVGGGITGLTAALEAAEAGFEVVLVEKNPSLGGRVAQLYQYFPKLCPPQCGLEINFKRLGKNPKVTIHTLSKVTKIEGEAGDFTVKITKSPRYVSESYKPGSKVVEEIEATVPNEFDYGMSQIKAVHMPHEMAYPAAYVADPCIIGTPDADKLKAALGEENVDLNQKEEEIEVNAAAVIWATGWTPYDPTKLETYNFSKCDDIITNVMMERLGAPTGPTGGKILCPSDGSEPKSIAFIQCAGSRDENHLPFCSTICCLASLKQAMFTREQYPEADITIYFIDIRAMDRNEDFYTKVKAEGNVNFVKSKIASIKTDGAKPVVEGENTVTGGKFTAEHDLVVLATGMQPTTAEEKIPAEGMEYDDYGFVLENPGIIAAGCSKAPRPVAYCVQAGSAAALKAIQVAGRK